jgi:hypothetical protein
MKSIPNTWTIRIGGDYILNFLIYVGSSLRILQGPQGQHIWPYPLHGEGEKDNQKLREPWDIWWNQAVKQKMAHERGERGTFMSDPPYFHDIPDTRLREFCIRVWPVYIHWWNMPAGGQHAMNYWENFPKVQEYVEEFERKARRAIKPFSLHIELIYAGFEEPIEPASDFVIMPLQSKFLMEKDWWLKRFIERY